MRKLLIAALLAPLLTLCIIEANASGDAQFPIDCAIVFGAAVGPNSQPGPALLRRVDTAVDLYHTRAIRRLILSGGKGTGNRLSEAQVMQARAEYLGVPVRAVTVEAQSHSTWENLHFARSLTEGCSSVVAISDSYHLARIRLLALRQQWEDLQFAPAQHPAAAVTPQERKAVIREVFAYLYYVFYMDRLS